MRTTILASALALTLNAGTATAQRGARSAAAPPAPQMVECARTAQLDRQEGGFLVHQQPGPAQKVNQLINWTGGPFIVSLSATGVMTCTYGYTAPVIGSTNPQASPVPGIVIAFSIETPFPPGKSCKISTSKAYTFECA
jgi:hypothetical protein